MQLIYIKLRFEIESGSCFSVASLCR